MRIENYLSVRESPVDFLHKAMKILAMPAHERDDYACPVKQMDNIEFKKHQIVLVMYPVRIFLPRPVMTFIVF